MRTSTNPMRAARFPLHRTRLGLFWLPFIEFVQSEWEFVLPSLGAAPNACNPRMSTLQGKTRSVTFFIAERGVLVHWQAPLDGGACNCFRPCTDCRQPISDDHQVSGNHYSSRFYTRCLAWCLPQTIFEPHPFRPSSPSRFVYAD